jgi:hypothetical protein
MVLTLSIMTPDTVMLRVVYAERSKPIMLSVVMLNVLTPPGELIAGVIKRF